MTTYERDQWDKIGDSTSEGARLKCANKGRWTLDDVEIPTGPDGFKIAVIMPSIVVGRVRWFESRIAERDIGRIEHGFEPPEGPLEGWNPYVQFLAVRADEENPGELLSFANSSWGGQSAYRSLVNPYRFKNRPQFPICTLGTAATSLVGAPLFLGYLTSFPMLSLAPQNGRHLPRDWRAARFLLRCIWPRGGGCPSEIDPRARHVDQRRPKVQGFSPGPACASCIFLTHRPSKKWPRTTQTKLAARAKRREVFSLPSRSPTGLFARTYFPQKRGSFIATFYPSTQRPSAYSEITRPLCDLETAVAAVRDLSRDVVQGDFGPVGRGI